MSEVLPRATQTPILGLNVPVVGADIDVWGGETNYNWTVLDGALMAATATATYVKLAGSTMTGPLILSGPPTQALQAATKGYVDGNAGQGGIIDAPNDGVAYGRESQAWVPVLPMSGGSLTGPLVLAGNATVSLGAVTLQQMDAALAAYSPFAIVDVADTAPSSPSEGLLWWDSVGGELYLWYSDPNTSQWVAASAGSANAVREAPADGQTYGRDGQTQSWNATLPTAGGTMSGPIVLAADPVAPMQPATKQYTDNTSAMHANILHNPFFNIQQRGVGPFTASGAYTADRWQMTVGNDTMTVSMVTLADADRIAIGDERAVSALQNTFAGSATASSYNQITQKIESVRRLSGKTVTFSFWARATSGAPKLGVYTGQIFGSGGSPSNAVSTVVGTTAALAATWAKYSFTVVVPSAAGKTFGTNVGTDYNQFYLLFSDTSNIVGTGIGQQSGTVQLWGMKLEVGNIATPIPPLDPREDLANAQRFYQSSGLPSLVVYGYQGGAGGFIISTFAYPVMMRANPTVAFTNVAYSNSSAIQANAGSNGYALSVQITVSAAGSAFASYVMTASADL